MGRSGGGGGGFSGGFGGGFSGGFSGGGRSSGGFSGGSSGGLGGGRSTPGSFGGGHRGGIGGFPFGGFGHGPIIVNAPRIDMGGSGGSGSGGSGDGSQQPQQPQQPPKKGNGCGTVFVIFAILLFLMFVFSLVGGNSFDTTRSTVDRVALPADAVVKTGYFTDEDGDWIADSGELEQGMRQFYIDTGVQPYLYILPNGTETSTVKLSERASELYSELFQDEAHFLLVFCDDGYGGFNCGYTVGAQAKTVMDSEALDIFADYLDRYYNDRSLSEEEMFSETYSNTAKRIMSVTPSAVVPVAVCVTIIVVVVVVAVVLKRRREAKEREHIRQQQILNTPIEKFGDSEIEELVAKYEQKE